MRLTFKQGIARYQTDVYASPAFLQKSSQSGEFIDLIVSPDPTIIVFAHKSAAYVIEESRTVNHAWGPFAQGGTRYLYWDVNLLDVSLTRGATHLPPIVANLPPASPANDQHWFDTAAVQMRVWNGVKWVDKLRVFAATYSSQAIIQPMGLGSQAGLTGSFDGGSIVLDSYNKPLRQSDGTFVTSATELSIINAASKLKLETEILTGMAFEFIPKFSFVQARPDSSIMLARSGNWRSRIIGLVNEDLYESEIGIVMTTGLIRNEQWNWSSASVGRPVFCGVTGEITLEAPTHGVVQIAGYVYSSDAIQLRIQPVTILDDLTHETIEELAGPPGQAPIAEFTVTPIFGTVPLTVSATSTSLFEPTMLSWDFENNGVINSTAPTAAYTFVTPGTYSVRLRVSNDFGTDEEVKTGLITVVAPTATGTFTNLGIQMSGPLQVGADQQFSVSVTVSNDGLKPASQVARTIIVDDMSGFAPVISDLPTGTITKRVGNRTVISFPIIGLMTGQYSQTSFSIKAPNSAGDIKLRASSTSPESDSTLSDNSTELMIKVK